MLLAISYGILTGIILAILVGPVFLALMSVTITQGVKKAYWFMAGSVVSDTAIAILAYNGIRFWGDKHSLSGHLVGIIGTLVFLGFGIYLLRKKEKPKDIQVDTKTNAWRIGNILLLSRGFIMNSFNPSIFVFWIAVLAQFVKRFHHPTHLTTQIFIASTLITFLITDIIKVHSAHWILKKLTIKNMSTLDKIAGSFLVLAGLIIGIRIIL